MLMETTYDPQAVESRWLGRREPGSVLPAGSRAESLIQAIREVAEDVLDRRARAGGRSAEPPELDAPDRGDMDPAPLIERVGVDAFRLGAILMVRNPLHVDAKRFEQARHFISKFWHASRLALELLGDEPRPGDGKPAFEDRWLASALCRMVQRVGTNLDAGRLAVGAEAVSDFVRHEFSEWYLPLAKQRSGDPALTDTLVPTIRTLCSLLHPLVPIVTEEIRNRLSRVLGEPPVRLAEEPVPLPDQAALDEAAEREMGEIIDLVKKIRSLRGLGDVPDGEAVRVTVSAAADATAARISGHEARIRLLAGLEELTTGVDLAPPNGAAGGVAGDAVVYLKLARDVDPRAEFERLRREADELIESVRGYERKLGSRDFLARAPAEVVEQARERRDELASRLEKIHRQIENLEDSRE